MLVDILLKIGQMLYPLGLDVTAWVSKSILTYLTLPYLTGYLG